MNFLAIIPARYASTRFPGKPLVDIKGESMIERVYKRASSCFEHCCVATDDERIKHEVERFGGIVVMTSTEHRSGTDRCAEALMKITQLTGKEFDVVINIQGDEPFVSQEQLTKIKECFQEPSVQLATLVKAFNSEEDIFNPNSPKVVVSNDNYAMYFSRSAIPYLRGVDQSEWQHKHKYFKHIGLYGYKSDVLQIITTLPQSSMELAESLEQLRWVENGFRIKVAETLTESIAIDTPEDLERILTMF